MTLRPARWRCTRGQRAVVVPPDAISCSVHAPGQTASSHHSDWKSEDVCSESGKGPDWCSVAFIRHQRIVSPRRDSTLPPSPGRQANSLCGSIGAGRDFAGHLEFLGAEHFSDLHGGVTAAKQGYLVAACSDRVKNGSRDVIPRNRRTQDVPSRFD